MGILRNLLAATGLVAILATGWAVLTFRGFEPAAARVYYDMAQQLIETGNAAEATVWKRQVAEGLSFDEVDESIRSLAASLNIKDVGALPLGEQVEAMMGAEWRRLKIYLYCNPLTAATMVDHSDAYAAWLPCRVSLLEDAKGRLWLYTLNMDLMLHGGRPLPEPVLAEANTVRETIVTLMDKAAAGEF